MRVAVLVLLVAVGCGEAVPEGADAGQAGDAGPLFETVAAGTITSGVATPILDGVVGIASIGISTSTFHPPDLSVRVIFTAPLPVTAQPIDVQDADANTTIIVWPFVYAASAEFILTNGANGAATIVNPATAAKRWSFKIERRVR